MTFLKHCKNSNKIDIRIHIFKKIILFQEAWIKLIFNQMNVQGNHCSPQGLTQISAILWSLIILNSLFSRSMGHVWTIYHTPKCYTVKHSTYNACLSQWSTEECYEECFLHLAFLCWYNARSWLIQRNTKIYCSKKGCFQA